ncbi:ABC transporter permease [Glaciihabitans sp. UYNi722]|uniref:ABC transporter permease n=1 Tax=Glaciihabitans sp. UYNi722 TaxID=3156344 RepID=UPI003398A0DD
MSELLLESSTISVHDSTDGPRKSIRRYLSPKLVVGATIVIVTVLFGVIVPFFAQDPTAVSNIGLAPPSAEHLFGTTQTGQDVFAQLAYGTRGSLLIGILVGALVLVLSAFFGIVGSFVGGFLDEAFSLISNVMLIIPGLPLMIVIGTYAPQKSVFLVAFVLAFTGWAAGARVLRGQTLSLRNRDYVLAARVSGEKTWRIICVEILPNLLPVMSSGFVFSIIFAILGEAGLSFIGIGSTGSLTWGTMLANAQNGQALLLGGWWWFAPPGLFIAVFGCGLALINFSIDEVIDPRLRAPRVKKLQRKTS